VIKRITVTMKKRSERRKHCALAVVRQSQKNCAPPQTPFPGGAGRPKFNQLEMVPTFTYKPSLMRIDGRNFELSWQQTLIHTNTPTHRQDQLQYTAQQLASAQCNKMHVTMIP